MTEVLTTDAWQRAYDVVRGADAAVDWLGLRRESGWRLFRECGFPGSRDEEWRLTDVAEVAGLEGVAPRTPSEKDIEAARSQLAALADPAGTTARLVFVNGRYTEALSNVSATEAVEVRPLAAALEEGAELEGRLGTLVTGRESAFTALNDALWQDGVQLRIAPGTQTTGPVHVVFFGHDGAAPSTAHPRLLVDVGAGANAILAESWIGDLAFTNAVFEAHVGANARLDHLIVESVAPEARQFHHGVVRLDRDARYQALTIALGGRAVRNDLTVRLDAEGAECWIDGLTLAHGSAHIEHRTTIDHAVPHGTSFELYKGILDNEATTAFSGRVLVRQDAQHTDSKQANHNLLLSKKALAHSIPQLEIFADDVKCAHGATVGQLDDEAVFYLRSRGISEIEARALLIEAFAGEVTGRVEQAGLRAHAEAIVGRALARRA